MISEAAIREFKEIWVKTFETEISDEVALEEAINLLTVFNAIYHPLKESDVEDYENEYEKPDEKTA